MRHLSDRLFEALEYVRYLCKAKGPHGVHSPLVFKLITEVLKEKVDNPRIVRIELLRKELLKNNDVLEVLDHGAGSRLGSHSGRTIKSIAATALQSPASAAMLYRLIRFFNPEQTIELGTSLGITSAYMAAAVADRGFLHTIEGAEQIANLARANLKALGIENVKVVEGTFQDKLIDVLHEMKRVDLALVDGHHLYVPTIAYYRTILPFCHDQSILIFDDIHWSPEMHKAWNEVRSDTRVTLSLDFFEFGLLFFLPNREVEHFILRRP